MTSRYLIRSVDHRGLATVTLNRPEKHNAFNEEGIAELTEALDDIGRDQTLRALILRANGENFSAGADLAWMRRMADNTREENIRDANALAELLHKLDALPLPVIARVQGAALGGGCGLVACCDIALAADNASFAFSEVKIGLIPATISPYVTRAIGAKQARRYFQTAERFDARRALALGLVSEVMEEAHLDGALEDLVETLLGNSGAAMRAAKQLLPEVAGQPVTPALRRLTSERIAEARASEEGKEGLAAFLERRRPAWRRDGD